MDKFEASNGTTITSTDEKVTLTLDGNAEDLWISRFDQEALREFFQHERDEELGRWRWPHNPDFVVYPRGESAVHVLDEGSGIGAARLIHRNGDPDNHTAEHRAAYAYFESHPERKPWEDAKPGEIWEVTIHDGTTHTVFVCENRNAGGRDGFTPEGMYFDIDGRNQGVVVTRRVYPAGD